MTTLKLTLTVLGIVISAAVVGAFLGQFFPRSGMLYVVPIGIGIGISIRFIARHVESRRGI